MIKLFFYFIFMNYFFASKNIKKFKLNKKIMKEDRISL